jgi:hypothetical protein
MTGAACCLFMRRRGIASIQEKTCPRTFLEATGTAEKILAAFRRVRDDLRRRLIPLLREKLQQRQSAANLR